MSDYFICPECGADVPVGAHFCPECYSDEETGWSEEAEYADLLPYDAGDSLAQEFFGGNVSESTNNNRYVLIALSVFTVIALVVSIGVGNPVFVILTLLGIGAYYYWTQNKPDSSAKREKALYQDLLSKARGDAALVQRWLDYEKSKNPDSTQLELMEDALIRWERDNH
ncbi:MAG: zinc ribbon domain-containing protein [Chloroflexota bacterium]